MYRFLVSDLVCICIYFVFHFVPRIIVVSDRWPDLQALNIKVNPLYLMLPAAVCCSYAFMLPVATPPNAIVFAAANMRSQDMVGRHPRPFRSLLAFLL